MPAPAARRRGRGAQSWASAPSRRPPRRPARRAAAAPAPEKTKHQTQISKYTNAGASACALFGRGLPWCKAHNTGASHSVASHVSVWSTQWPLPFPPRPPHPLSSGAHSGPFPPRPPHPPLVRGFVHRQAGARSKPSISAEEVQRLACDAGGKAGRRGRKEGRQCLPCRRKVEPVWSVSTKMCVCWPRVVSCPPNKKAPSTFGEGGEGKGLKHESLACFWTCLGTAWFPPGDGGGR